jgi:hypothetical protein
MAERPRMPLGATSLRLNDLAARWGVTVKWLGECIHQELLTVHVLLHEAQGVREAVGERRAATVVDPPGTISAAAIAHMRSSRRMRLNGYYRVAVTDAMAVWTTRRSPWGARRDCKVFDEDRNPVQLESGITWRDLRVLNAEVERFEREQLPATTQSAPVDSQTPTRRPPRRTRQSQRTSRELRANLPRRANARPRNGSAC